MKKLLLALVAFVGVFALPAKLIAQKCNLDVDKVDVFSKERVRSSVMSIGEKRNRWKLSLERTNDKYSWAVSVIYAGEVSKQIEKGDIIKLRLENGKILDLVVGMDCMPVSSIFNLTVITAYLPKGTLDEAAVKDLAASPITNIQTKFFGYSNDIEIKSKQGDEIQETAKCLLKS